VVAGFEQCTVTVRDFGPACRRTSRTSCSRAVRPGGPGRQTAGGGTGLVSRLPRESRSCTGGGFRFRMCPMGGASLRLVLAVLRGFDGAGRPRVILIPPALPTRPRKRGTHPQDEGIFHEPPLAGPHEADRQHAQGNVQPVSAMGPINVLWPDVSLVRSRIVLISRVARRGSWMSCP